MAETISNPISTVVEVHGGYASYVDLGLDFLDDTRNYERMANYRPIFSHRQAFEKLARSLNVQDKRCYLLTGAYGTGKSHLSLMFANYMQLEANERAMQKFFENYSEVDSVRAEELKAKRATGRYLVAVCEWTGTEDFAERVLRAVDAALLRVGFEEELETPYLQALHKIEEWEQLVNGTDARRRFFSEFERELMARNPGLTIAAFKKKLEHFDLSALEEFKRIHPLVTTAPFVYDKNNLLAILKSVLSSQKFRERYRGILVLWDEFGHALDGQQINPKEFQQFAQLCAEPPPDSARLVFLATAHRSLTDYASAYNYSNFRVAQDRIEEVAVGISGVEDIIGAIVSPRKSHELWQQEIAPLEGVFDTLQNDCKRLKLFDWLSAVKIRRNIIENIFPMHPMATYAVLKMSESVGSSNRSVFNFFGGGLSDETEEGSFRRFLVTEPIKKVAKLNLYTADRLCEYFAAALKSDNRELRQTLKEYVKNYETSLRELKRVTSLNATDYMNLDNDQMTQRILQLMLVYQIIGIENNEMNLRFGLYCSNQAEQRQLENRLRELTNKNILYFNRDQGGVYEFKQSSGIDLDRMVDEYSRNSENWSQNFVVELKQHAPLGRNELFLEAREYNAQYNQDKRLERRFVRVADLEEEEELPGGKRNYFEKLEEQIEKEIITPSRGEYEGLALYVLCQNPEEIQKARDLCARNTSRRIVVAIPREPLQLREKLLELKALQYLQNSEESKNFTPQDKALLESRLNGDPTKPNSGAKEAVKKLRDRLLSNREVNWFEAYAAAVQIDERNNNDIADKVMLALYTERNTFSHDDFNKTHHRIDRTRTPLKDAVEKLLDSGLPISIDTSSSQQRGERRYLERCLLQRGALTQLRNEAGKLRCEIENDPACYATNLPALAAMVREVSELKPETHLKIVDFLNRYRRHPYGQGNYGLALALTFVLRRFGDAVQVKQYEGAVSNLKITTFESIMNLVEGSERNAYLHYRPLSVEEKDLVNFIYARFGESSAAGQNYTVVQAQSAIREWWYKLPTLSKNGALYPAEQYEFTAAFAQAIQKIDGRDAHAFLFDDLPVAFGLDTSLQLSQDNLDALKWQLPHQKEKLEHAPEMIERQILDRVGELFGASGQVVGDLQSALGEWFERLDSNQKDPTAPWQDRTTRKFLTLLGQSNDLTEIFLVKLPQDINFKSVREWSSNRAAEYLQQLKQLKTKIDDNRIKVTQPEINYLSIIRKEEDGKVYFRKEVKLEFYHPDEGIQIFVVEGDSNPANASNSQRKIVNGHEPLVINNNKVINVQARDGEGNWSKPQKLELINDLAQYQIQPPQQVFFNDKPQTVSIIVPKDIDSFMAAVRSLVDLVTQQKLLTATELAEQLEKLVEQLRKDQDQQ